MRTRLDECFATNPNVVSIRLPRAVQLIFPSFHGVLAVQASNQDDISPLGHSDISLSLHSQHLFHCKLTTLQRSSESSQDNIASFLFLVYSTRSAYYTLL